MSPSSSGGTYAWDPLHAFRFKVMFYESKLGADGNKAAGGDSRSSTPDSGSDLKLGKGAFSEITGLEATVEPFSITEGGWNYGQLHRVGRTTFSTVILRRGMTTTRHLWKWFYAVNKRKNGAYMHRLKVVIELRGPAWAAPQDGTNGPDSPPPEGVRWTLHNAMPVKMKLADLNSVAQEVAVEELHLVHEGIEEELIEAGGAGGAG